jgi:hypothetical protein
MAGTVVILGAGATKSSGGPLTKEILPGLINRQPDAANPSRFAELEQFLAEQFHVQKAMTREDEYPALPLVMSLLDVSLDRRQPFQGSWDVAKIAKVRQAVELGIFELLESKLQTAPTNTHWELLTHLYPAPAMPTVISLNYDLIVDTAMMYISQQPPGEGRFPDYCCDIQSNFYRDEPARYGKLLKLHGSLNWLYCNNCHRLEIGASESRRYINVLGRVLANADLNLDRLYLENGNPCPTCKKELRPLLIAPTHLKDYRNPHLSQVWYHAERALREASRVIFIGYSLPDDDLEVIYLLKRGLGHLRADQITVVELDDQKRVLKENPVGRRYRALFGDVDWYPGGLTFDWINQQGTKAIAVSA